VELGNAIERNPGDKSETEKWDFFAGGKVILSKSGVQQGDPLGPLLFAIAIHSLILDQHCRYLDDGTAIGLIDTLVTFVDRLIQNSSSYGLSVNISFFGLLDAINGKRSLLICAV
jgi:hypothetical protein